MARSLGPRCGPAVEFRFSPKLNLEAATLRITVGPGDLAASRFAIAPMSELEHLLRRLDAPSGRTPTGTPIRATRWWERYRPVRHDLPARLLRALRPPGWGPDLTSPPPVGLNRTPAAELATIRDTEPRLARTQIRRALELGGPVDDDVRRALTGRDAVGRIADALELMWDVLIAPDWPQLLAINERDVLHRAESLARSGWAAALDGLHPTLRWEAGRIVITGRPHESATLDGRGLAFVPSVFLHPRIAMVLEPPWQPAIRYPARGSAALWETNRTPPGALARLLGATRARLLVELADPASTVQLVRSTGFPLGSVGDHLRVLREAGFVERARIGRSVVYRRTPVGDAVAAGAAV